ncbi:hypothetical protein DWY69_20845 [Eisenbergiella massiliensis]|uniref:Uncharacterized protein n=1 Tax=Eisenbergiella massiliensis TaxID=1720294 RepID=A0A3E3IM19_9FIRM|nr:hypothetical protein DWY69_20845 [Eisenbergiella massiliensis]
MIYILTQVRVMYTNVPLREQQVPLNGFIYAALRVLKVTQGQQAQRVLQEHRDHRVQLGQQDLQAPPGRFI